jgi:Zn-dependent peptidase ImmA (M78 family)
MTHAVKIPFTEFRDGLRVAKLFRQSRGLVDTRACDLEEVCDDSGIEIVDSAFADPGYTACLKRCEDGTCGLIALRPGQDRGRRRFSIAHELGHFHIPKHRSLNGYCADEDMRARQTDANRREWEANDFATELLMPRRLFSGDLNKLDISIASARKLADPDHYDVSVMAAAWRMVQTTAEAAAIVVSSSGRVKWMYRSNAFRLPLSERDQQVGGNTLAATSFASDKSTPEPLTVDPGAWLDRAYDVMGTLLESTHFIPSLRQTVSLLWLTATDERDDE